MKNNFHIICNWLKGNESDSAEYRLAEVSVMLADKCLTRHSNLITGSRAEASILAPYPLAIWFAANWWRLRWEPTPPTPSLDWRMSHMLSAAGHGFCWPSICFQSDGEYINILSLPTQATNGASVIYETFYTAPITSSYFEDTVDVFVDSYLKDMPQGEVQALWNAVSEERADPTLSRYRKLEAIMGYDPDEGPKSLISDFMNWGSSIGEEAAQEISVETCKHQQIKTQITDLLNVNKGIVSRVDDIDNLKKYYYQKRQSMKPWEVGFALAQLARKKWGIDDVFSSRRLSEIMNFDEENLGDSYGINFPIGMAFRENCAGVNLYINKKHPTAKRFMAARLLCDSIIASDCDKLLPSTDGKTARQKTQRAFAAELLCPSEGIISYTGGDFSDDSLTEAADHYKVSPLVITNHLTSKGFIARDNSVDVWKLDPVDMQPILA